MQPRCRTSPALAEHYGPAVVNVGIVGKQQAVADFPGMSPNDPFCDFFRRFGQPRGNPQPIRAGEGSGFIVSPDGYILTNAHVVEDADEVTVKTHRPARVSPRRSSASTSRRDVAVLKIEAKNLPTVQLGDPDKLRPGEWVRRDRLAVRLREQRDRGHRQRDVARHARRQLHAVHPDRRRGESRQLRRPAVQPERRSRRHQLADLQPHRRLHGRVVRDPDRRREQREGAARSRPARSRAAASASSIQDVTAQLAESFGLDRPRGALVGTVEDDGPGAKGGIKAGDVILKVDGDDHRDVARRCRC